MHAFGWPAAGSERVVAVLSPNVFLLHWPRAAGGGLVRAGAAGVLFQCLHSQGRSHKHEKSDSFLCTVTFTYDVKLKSKDTDGSDWAKLSYSVLS